MTVKYFIFASEKDLAGMESSGSLSVIHMILNTTSSLHSIWWKKSLSESLVTSKFYNI